MKSLILKKLLDLEKWGKMTTLKLVCAKKSKLVFSSGGKVYPYFNNSKLIF